MVKFLVKFLVNGSPPSYFNPTQSHNVNQYPAEHINNMTLSKTDSHNTRFLVSLITCLLLQ